MKIKWIEQKHKSSCSIACIAMILDFDYDFIIDQFENDFDTKGNTLELAKKYLTYNGMNCIELRSFGFEEILQINQKMLRPFADIHYISIQQFIDSKTNHAVVMDNKGRIFDPGDKNRTKFTHDDLFEVSSVLGLWYPSKTRTLVKKKK